MKEPLLYKILRPIIKLYTILLYHPKIINASFIPDNGRIILAGNHTNNLDCILLMSSTSRVVHFLAKNSLINGSLGFLFKSMGIIPVDRSIHDKKALKSGEDVLKKDGVIGIFPEGTINKTNDIIMPFKIGAVKMSYDTNTKIIPFTIKGKFKPFKNDLELRFYEPISALDDLTKENEKLMSIVNNNLKG